MSTDPTNEMLQYFEGYSKYSKKQIKETADLLRELSEKLSTLSDGDDQSKGKNAFLILTSIFVLIVLLYVLKTFHIGFLSDVALVITATLGAITIWVLMRNNSKQKDQQKLVTDEADEALYDLRRFFEWAAIGDGEVAVAMLMRAYAKSNIDGKPLADFLSNSIEENRDVVTGKVKLPEKQVDSVQFVVKLLSVLQKYGSLINFNDRFIKVASETDT